MDNIDKTDDEQLSAYIDGELTDAEVATLVTRLANEPALVKRLEAMRSGDQAVRAVYESLERVPLPDGVTQLLDVKDGESGDDNVVTFRRRGMPRLANFGYAIAASVALVAGFLAFRQGDVDPGLAAIDSLVAGNLGPDSDIHAFLDTGVSGQPQALGDSAEMRIVLSFQDQAGDYCRQLYVAAPEQSVHGVACRAASGWQLEVVATGAPAAPGEQYQTATAETPETVSDVVDSLIGPRDPLSKDQEISAISETWKKLSE